MGSELYKERLYFILHVVNLVLIADHFPYMIYALLKQFTKNVIEHNSACLQLLHSFALLN